MNTENMTEGNTLAGGVTALNHLGVIRAVGVDAATFLQGQLTQDFVLLGLHEARLTAYCSPKGRMLASFIAFKRETVTAADGTASAPEILLICNQDILAQTLKRLSMFVMRAKVKLTDASADFSIYGLTGEAFESAAIKIAGKVIHTPTPTLTKVDFGPTALVALYPALGQPRGLWVTPAGEAAPAGELLSAELWHWADVHSGIAHISLPVVEAFVPQMLNYESVGGVNFKKGCYPGQEVVARSQFRGTLKRRAYVVQIDEASAEPAVGQEVFHSSDAEQPCGTIAQVAASPTSGFTAIVSMQVAASADGTLTLGSAKGAKIKLLPLPYLLLEDI